MTRPGKKIPRRRNSNPGFCALEVDALTIAVRSGLSRSKNEEECVDRMG